MKKAPSKLIRPLIRVSYCLPLLVGLALLIFAGAPHLFYFYEGDPKVSKSIFELLSDAWGIAVKQLGGTIESTPDTMYYPYIAIFSVIVSWVCIILYAIVAVSSAVCSTVAFVYPPTSKPANQAKRWMHLLCPNRVTYAVFQLLPILPACFPLILEHCQRTMFALDLRILYDIGMPDWLFVSILVCIPVLLWLLLLPSQNKEHMDMYRLYKSKN